MKPIAWYTFSFLIAVVATSVLASIFSSQFVIAGLQGIGVDISLPVRITMTIEDLAILRVLLLSIAACFLFGFLVAGFVAPRLPGSRLAWFVAAGAISLTAELLLISSLLGLMPVAGARTTAGLLAQGVAGGFGGWCFAWVSRLKRESGQ